MTPDLLLCLSALTLGARHGLDFDHISAISDLVGHKVGLVAALQGNDAVASRPSRMAICTLAASYALGHGAIVFCLGASALLFRAMLPQWIDPIMQKFVGATLVAMGALLLINLQSGSNNIKSRGFLLMHVVANIKHWFEEKFLNRAAHVHQPLLNCNWQCAASIGVLHGIGAETGSQILLLTSLFGSNNLASGFATLLSFLAGILVSNLSLALFVSEGYCKFLNSSRALSTVTALTALSSILFGGLFIYGSVEIVPSINWLFSK